MLAMHVFVFGLFSLLSMLVMEPNFTRWSSYNVALLPNVEQAPNIMFISEFSVDLQN